MRVNTQGESVRKKEGFTLTEILIVLVILGVIAGLALPAYFNTVEQGRSNESRVNLSIVLMGEKVYATNSPGNNYWLPGANPPLNGAGSVNQTLNVDISTQYFDIVSITGNNAVNPKTLLVTVRRNNLFGGDGVTTRTIDQNGTLNPA